MVFRNGFKEQDAAFILKKVLQMLSNLQDRCTHHGSLNTVHIYLDSNGNILIGYCDSLFKDAAIPPTPWMEPQEFLTMSCLIYGSSVPWHWNSFIHPIQVELKKSDGLIISKSFKRSTTCQASFERFTTCQGTLVKSKAKVSKTFKKVKTGLEAKKKTKRPFHVRGKSLSR